jgi:hypothetical protein
MTDATLEYILGLGGFALDPGGAATICRRTAALGVNVPTPYPQNNLQPVYDAVQKLPAAERLFLAGDSCGVTRIVALANDIPDRVITGMYCIQGSFWCKGWPAPTIGPNVRNVIVFYSSWMLTGGLGVWCPQCAVMDPSINYYDGKPHPANNGKTLITYLYVPDLHPGDTDTTGVQDPILTSIKSLIAA